MLKPHKTLELNLFIPSSCDGLEQPIFLCKFGKKWLRATPDPGATTTWVTSADFQHHERSVASSVPGWMFPPLGGFDLKIDTSPSFQALEEDAPEIIHDGFRASAQWVVELLSVGDDKEENISVPLKTRILNQISQETPYIINYDLLLGLGLSEKHRISSNWLLTAALVGMPPKFTYRCGLGHRGRPTLGFGLGLLPKEGFLSRFFFIHKHEQEQPGSQWFLRIKGIIWKCKDENEESFLDMNHCTYAQKWKNIDKDKIFTARSYSWGWFDMGYATITLPKTLGSLDSFEVIKLMKDIKAGQLAVQSGQLAPPVILDAVRLEWISFVFDDEATSDGTKIEGNKNDKRWTFHVDEMVNRETGERLFEIEYDSPSTRKCIIFGLPFAKKYSIEYSYDPAFYRSDWEGPRGTNMIGFEHPVD